MPTRPHKKILAERAGDGSSWQTAYKFLQDALVDAESSAEPAEIGVAQGIYKPDQGAGIEPGDRAATFRLLNGVTVKGGYAGLSEPDPNAWDPVSEDWVLDDVTSPCIGAGDPNSPVGLEPFPNGGRVNMGAYGGTAEASMSPDVSPTAGLRSEPLALLEVNLDAVEGWSLVLSADGLTLYFGRVGRPESCYGRIFQATRRLPVPWSRFAPVIEVPGTLNRSVEHVLTPWVSYRLD